MCFIIVTSKIRTFPKSPSQDESRGALTNVPSGLIRFLGFKYNNTIKDQFPTLRDTRTTTYPNFAEIGALLVFTQTLRG